jgi:Tol biopolymer transport system component/TolB-like protein
MCKKIIIILLIAAAALAAPKVKIAFMGIEPSGVSESVASGVSSSFLNGLINTYRFEVVERERLAALMEEQGLAISGCTTTECFVQVGRLAGAQKVVVGNVSRVGGSYLVSVRVVDVYSSRVEQSLAEESSSLEGLLTVADRLAVQLAGTISVEGTVVSVSGDTIKIDLGKQEGVDVDDTVYLVRLGEEYYHPETGMFLGRDIEELGEAEITKVLADELSEAVLQGSFSVMVGDKVRLATRVSVSPVAVTPGGRIAFYSDRDGGWEIYVMDGDGRNQTRLTTSIGHALKPAWSPDGSRIAFNGDGIYVMDADGSNQTRLTTSGGDECPTWSPDGRRIVFASYGLFSADIFVMDADGSNRTQLTTTDNDILPAWSPDGRSIAFSSKRDGDYEIFVMDADGSNQTQLTNNTSNDWYTAWSLDGRSIAFSSDRDGDYEIFVMDADGSNQTQLTNNTSDDDEPAWSPDGRRIAFASGGFISSNIFVMDADGGNVTQLTTQGGASPAWCPVE